MSTSTYLIAGQVISHSDPNFENALVNSYKSKGRPLCLCKTPGVEMYIARNGDSGHIIKRMPNTGQTHHPDCESFEIPSELSGRGAVQGKAITEDQDTGLVNLKLDFTLSKTSVNRSATTSDSKETTSVKADPSKLGIRSLLHYLYEDAALNKWTPNMTGKRSWYTIRKYLLLSAQNKTARKNLISESLLIPEVFTVEKKQEIANRRRHFLSKLKKKGKKQPMGILIGEVKSIEEARFGHKLIIKHMPDTPIYVPEDVHKRMNKAFAKEISFFMENETIHLLTICTFLLSPSGSPQVDTISFMTVDDNWLPFDDIHELELIQKLCAEKRNFIKGLRYNLGQSDIIASVLLTNSDSNLTAIYIVPAGANEHYYEELDAVITNSQLKSHVIDINKITAEAG